MAIGGVGSYGNYSNSYVRNNNVNKSEKTEEAEDTAMTKEDFLKELKKEFPKANIYTAKITPSNSKNFVGGTGIYNFAVSDEYLEEMASSPEKRAEFKKDIQANMDAVKSIQGWAKRDGLALESRGITIDSEGNKSGWSSYTRNDKQSNTSFQNVGTKINNSQSSIFKSEETREKRRLEQKELEEKTLEKRELERKEEKEAEESRVEKQRDEKRLEERRAKERELEEKLAEMFTDKKVEQVFIYDDEPKVKQNFVSAFNSPSIKFKNNIDFVGKYQSDLNVGVEQGFNKEI